MTDSLESKLQFEIALYGAKGTVEQRNVDGIMWSAQRSIVTGCPISDLWSVLVREQNITVKQAQANELWKKLVTSKDFEFIKVVTSSNVVVFFI